MGKSRVFNSMRNATTGMFAYFITLLLQIANRSVFIAFLSTEYLGINGLFTNVLAMLSLSELGIGSAIVYSLYKPIAENDIEKTKSLMQLYKKIYTLIGVIVLIMGAIITPFIKLIIKDAPDIPFLELYFLLYVIDSGLSYFYTYKRSMLICDQKSYISSISLTIKNVSTRLLQILFLALTRNFMIYLIVQIICTRLENVMISKICDKQYPYLKDTNFKKLDDEDKKTIKKNTLAMICHKLGTVMINATDNIIVSAFIGLNAVGLTSNYTLIINSVSSLSTKIIDAFTPSVGNLIASSEKDKVKITFDRLLFANYILLGFCYLCLFCLLQDFIVLWIGKKFLYGMNVVFVYIFYFYISGMRRTVLIFKDAAGLFYEDRFKPVAESIVNLVISIPLTIRYGVVGVRAGSILTCIGVAFWIEAMVLFKHYFSKGLWKYFSKQLLYLAIVVCGGFGINFILGFIPGNGIIHFAIKACSCVILSVFTLIIFFIRTQEFTYYFGIFKKLLLRICKKR